MYQTIHETIAVAGVYDRAKFLPKSFVWRQRKRAVSEITLMANINDGGIKKRHYAVIAENNLYRLLFDRQNEVWWLEEIWME